MIKTPTLAQLLSNTGEQELLDIYAETSTGIVPSIGNAHRFCKRVNLLIDAGRICISESNGRHIYLPTLEKAIEAELAKRYVEAVKRGSLKLTPEGMAEQLTLWTGDVIQ